MTQPDHYHTGVVRWRKSSRSGGGANGGNCIEIGVCCGQGVSIRDSKHRLGATLQVDVAEWPVFLTTVQTIEAPGR
ncbi:MAG TPA: DUF397 domain-containing protein [Candidatus Stackebrandtia excrementipullorum]|nr:DUF397 domain-containing protein [Candidatus Stackebrandtia excrementipullorum]